MVVNNVLFLIEEYIFYKTMFNSTIKITMFFIFFYRQYEKINSAGTLIIYCAFVFSFIFIFLTRFDFLVVVSFILYPYQKEIFKNGNLNSVLKKIINISFHIIAFILSFIVELFKCRYWYCRSAIDLECFQMKEKQY